MRIFATGLVFTLLSVSFALGVGCKDTVVVIANGAPGYTAASGTYNPDAAGAINGIINTCSDASMVLTLRFADAGRGDTLRLSSKINVRDRNTGGKTTEIVGSGTGGDIVTLLETSTTDPQLIAVQASNPTTLRNLGFARKMSATTSIHSVAIAARNSKVIGCHFWMADNSSDGTGSLLDITTDSVLVERSVFRATPGGTGRSIAIRTGGGSAQVVEIRANLFYSTGLFLAATTQNYHIYANTFAGSREKWNAIIIGGTGTAPDKNLAIEHNLFAPKNAIHPPIAFSSGGALSPDGILKNAWTRGPAGVALAVNGANPPVALTLAGATGVNSNVALPKGFNNYGTGSYQIKDYPLTQLRADSLLSRKHADFGKIFGVFAQTAWFGTMPDVSEIPASRLFYPNFSPLVAGRTWTSNIKVGAFVDLDAVETPAPLDSGAQGSALKFEIMDDVTKIKVAARNFDLDYYKSTPTTLTPEFVYYFFSNSLDTLRTSNDSTVLKSRVGAGNVIRRNFLGDSLIMAVPPEVRVPDKDIYVKMLHYRKTFQAPVQSDAAIATVKGVPPFPLNDLTIKVDSTNSNFAAGSVNLAVTRGTESIDSVRVVAANQNGGIAQTQTKAVSGSSLSFQMSLSKGVYVFNAVPVAKLPSGAAKSGSPTANTAQVTLAASADDIVYVTLRTGAGCPGTGASDQPFCSLDTALIDIDVKKGNTIIVRNGSPSVPIPAFTIPSSPADSIPLTITVATTAGTGKYEADRPIFRGTAAASALTIARRNVTLRGFVLEMPVAGANTALNVTAGGSVIDGNIFRAQAKGMVEGFAVRIGVGGADMRFVNNVVWGYTKQVQIANSTATSVIRIMHNTFVEDPTLANAGRTVGIASLGPTLNAVVANNFFSGIAIPMDSSVAAKALVLDHNVYTVPNPQLQSLADAGALDSSSRVGAIDIHEANYVSRLENAFSGAIDCSDLAPCNPLYAGASANTYQTTVSTDMVGKPRTNWKEVGAFEFPSNPNPVLGTISLQLSRGSTFSRVNFVVSSKTFDPSETDSVHVFWSQTPLTSFAGIPAANHAKFPIARLASGSFTDTATGLEDDKTYHFYAALGRTTTSRKLSYAASASIKTDISVVVEDCDFASSRTVCPSETGKFVPLDPIWTSRVKSQVVFAQPVESGEGLFKNPTVTGIGVQKVKNLDLGSPFPKIVLEAEAPGLGEAKSDQAFTFTLELDATPALGGYSLFRLPEDEDGLAAYHPSWTLQQTATGTVLTIKSSQAGKQEYAFAKLQAGLQAGTIGPADAEDVPFFDFGKEEDVLDIPVAFKGAAFKTSNPLVLISVVPAGGMVDNPLKDYHSRSLLLSSGFADLAPEERRASLYQYLVRAAKADTEPGLDQGLNKPFKIDSAITLANFEAMTVLDGPDLEIGSDGVLEDSEVELPISKRFREERFYRDGTRKASRSLEVVYSVFDGARWSRGRSFIRTRFTNGDLHETEQPLGEDQIRGYERSTTVRPMWNFFGYPWDEVGSDDLARILGQDKKWDPSNMRLMSYKKVEGGSSPGDFHIYTGANSENIKYDSGHAVWAGSTNRVEPISDTGLSLDYRTFSLPLEGNVYNDFASPFNFPMRWKDILDSSNLSESQVPAFRYSPFERKWTRLSVGSGDVPGSIVTPWDGMTVKPPISVTLKFPILDTMRSTTPSRPSAKASAGSKNAWSARVKAFNSTATMTLGIGMAARPGHYPEAPSVPGQNFRLALLRQTAVGQEPLSELVQAENGDWQGHWTLRASAAEGAEGVSLTLDDNAKGIPLFLVDVLHQNVLPLTSDAPVKLTAGDLRENEYHIVAGDAAYLKKILDGLAPVHLLALSNYPNPFSGSTLFRYALPESFGQVTFDLKVRDFRGRTVWEKTIRGGHSLRYMWDGRDKGNSTLPAGVYTLSLEASAVGKPMFRATRRLLRM